MSVPESLERISRLRCHQGGRGGGSNLFTNTLITVNGKFDLTVSSVIWIYFLCVFLENFSVVLIFIVSMLNKKFFFLVFNS